MMTRQQATTLGGLVGVLALKRPFILVTWLSAALFGALYSIEDQIVVFGSGVANFTGVNLPTRVIVFGPEPMQGPPNVAYYLTVLGSSLNLQVNLSGLLVVGMLAVLFGINLSLTLYLRRSWRAGGGRRRFTSLLSVLPSLLSTSGCCCCAPLYFLLLGGVAADSLGFALLPYFDAFFYGSLALMLFNAIYFGRKALCAGEGSACWAGQTTWRGPLPG